MALANPNNDHAPLSFSYSFSTPTDTPYRTPATSLSRRSSRYGSSSPVPSSSPPLLHDHTRPATGDATTDENISILDPRRFTPTLHASLVSEILSLRRDVESKNGFIEGLEANLHSTRRERDALDENLAATSKESRSLRRQLQLLEGGTSSALGELARERDEAVESLAEARRRLETCQKRIRAEEENATRVQQFWDRDKQRWEGQRRDMERKVHIVEGRLKAILEEVAAQQAARESGVVVDEAEGETDQDDLEKDEAAIHGRDSGAIRPSNARAFRPFSVLSNDSVRISVLSAPNGYMGSKLIGVSLADELEADEDDDGDEDEHGPELEEESHRNESSAALAKHGETPSHAGSGTGETELKGESRVGATLDLRWEQASSAHWDNGRDAIKRTFAYADAGAQTSPPPSPKTALKMPVLPTTDDQAHRPREQSIHGGTWTVADDEAPPVVMPYQPMVCSFAQTVDELQEEPEGLGALRPRRTPLRAEESTSGTQTDAPETLDAGTSPRSPSDPTGLEKISCATQTDPSHVPQPTRPPPPPPVTIPSIAIHPPSSGPATAGPPVLPPHSRHAGCQVSPGQLVKLRSTSVQTEEIRIDKRTVKLPARLLPSYISSAPPTPDQTRKRVGTGGRPSSPPAGSRGHPNNRTPVDVPSSPPRPLASPDPLESDEHNVIKRGPRFSNSFSGPEHLSSDEGEDFNVADLSDGDYRTALSAPNHQLNPTKSGTKTSAKLDQSKKKPGQVSQLPFRRLDRNGDQDGSAKAVPAQTVKRGPTATQPRLDTRPNWNQSRDSVMRRSAMVTNGLAAYPLGTGSPAPRDGGDGWRNPVDSKSPFPVPTRSSSRLMPISASEGGRSLSRNSGNIFSAGRKLNVGRPLRNNSLRKVRSTTVISRNGFPLRKRSRSPPLPYSPLSSPTSPQLPPIPNDEVTTPRSVYNRGHAAQTDQLSTNTAQTGVASIGSSNSQNGVVDAIAQTMVGEWMWKYVRRRKSFGKPDNGLDLGKGEDEGLVNISGNGVRHKRWVWLAPYERAVMWSSKQPTSGTALLGKGGRKLTIQSVLDVKDDAAPPKHSNAQTVFGRSILILTPARALKFTATSKERHYVWLTALSFLSRPSLADDELAALPPPPLPRQELDGSVRPPAAALRRHPIRDSIRVAKGKARAGSVKSGGPSQDGSTPQGSVREMEDRNGCGGALVVAADPPTVPRFSNHARHRSNTGGRPPLGSLRSFTQPAMPSSYSVGTNGSSDFYGTASSHGGFGLHSGPSSLVHRSSDVSSQIAPTTTNFFDAVGTVRMEAFVRGATPVPAQDEKWKGQIWNEKQDLFAHRMDGRDDFFRVDDPFRGF